MATVLAKAPQLLTIGEIHQFLDYLVNQKQCACGQQLSNCAFWSPIAESITDRYSLEQLQDLKQRTEAAESHLNLPKAFLKTDKEFVAFFANFHQILANHYPNKVFLDSSKYVGRALQLSRIKSLDLKVIYVVRDIRGVAYSFGKQVQTPKSPLKALNYYGLINFVSLMAQFILGKKRVRRVKYEDFVANPQPTLESLQEFLNIDLKNVQTALKNNDPFEMPHIIAGNRLKHNKTIKLRPDLDWKENLSGTRKVAYYLLSLPLQLIFRYPI